MLAAQVPKTGRWLEVYLGGLVHPTSGWVPVPLKLMKSACLEDLQPLTQRPEQLCHGREKSEILSHLMKDHEWYDAQLLSRQPPTLEDGCNNILEV